MKDEKSFEKDSLNQNPPQKIRTETSHSTDQRYLININYSPQKLLLTT
jgi:hypothetical protein